MAIEQNALRRFKILKIFTNNFNEIWEYNAKINLERRDKVKN